MNRSREKVVLYCTGQQVQNDAVDAADFVVVEEIELYFERKFW